MNAKPNILVRLASLSDQSDASAVLRLLTHYAEQPFGMGSPLPTPVQERIIPALKQIASSRIFLALEQMEAVGLAVCFIGFSTFRARHLLNIHDLVVHESVRGQGVGGKLIDFITEYATEQGFSSVTLEVNRDNPALQLYSRKGFRNLQADDPDGMMLFGKLILPEGQE